MFLRVIVIRLSLLLSLKIASSLLICRRVLKWVQISTPLRTTVRPSSLPRDTKWSSLTFIRLYIVYDWTETKSLKAIKNKQTTHRDQLVDRSYYKADYRRSRSRSKSLKSCLQSSLQVANGHNLLRWCTIVMKYQFENNPESLWSFIPIPRCALLYAKKGNWIKNATSLSLKLAANPSL